MGVLSVSLTFVGYLLVYAAVANHGAFATQPWAGLIADAYDGTDKGVLPGLGQLGPIKKK